MLVARITSAPFADEDCPQPGRARSLSTEVFS